MTRGFPLALSTTLATAVAALVLLAPVAGAAEASGQDPLPAKAGEFSLKLEPGVAFPLTSLQSDLFDTGGGVSVKGLWSLNRYLGAGPSVSYLSLPTADPAGEFGTAWAFGASLVLRRPHDLPDGAGLANLSPWIDADLQWVRTGPLDRFGFAVGAGAAFPVGRSRTFWIGPFVRYAHIVQAPVTGYDDRDAKILIVGISLEVGQGVERPQPPGKAGACPDRDADGVPDAVDRCPDGAGPWENHGCPPYKRLVVKPDKLELRERLYFAWDQAVLEAASFPVLDEVVQALKDNKGIRVQVEGHTSSEGGEAHNQDLSERRAEAVLDYLVSHGVEKERLVSKGFSSSVPIASNTTQAGRDQNRRVEFVVNFIIINDGRK